MSLRAAALALPWHRPPGQVWRRGNPLLTRNSRKTEDCFGRKSIALATLAPYASAGVTFVRYGKKEKFYYFFFLFKKEYN
jgi:hypothetical protein